MRRLQEEGCGIMLREQKLKNENVHWPGVKAEPSTASVRKPGVKPSSPWRIEHPPPRPSRAVERASVSEHLRATALTSRPRAIPVAAVARSQASQPLVLGRSTSGPLLTVKRAAVGEDAGTRWHRPLINGRSLQLPSHAVERVDTSSSSSPRHGSHVQSSAPAPTSAPACDGSDLSSSGDPAAAVARSRARRPLALGPSSLQQSHAAERAVDGWCDGAR